MVPFPSWHSTAEDTNRCRGAARVGRWPNSWVPCWQVPDQGQKGAGGSQQQCPGRSVLLLIYPAFTLGADKTRRNVGLVGSSCTPARLLLLSGCS